ncbi:MAG: urea ABC transporter permease subunit UrtB, partial [Paracoccaceae bacterium]|nr:urea ABC transporter permease subunit UrtB [Paracoccaceae bacterium]
MFRLLSLALTLWLTIPAVAVAQSLQDILQTHDEEVLNPGRQSVSVVLEDLIASGLPQALPFLEAWRDREIVQRSTDGLFFRAAEAGGTITLTDLDTAEVVGTSVSAELTDSRPNGGVRRAIGDAWVQVQLSDPDISRRQSAVDAIARSMDASQLAPLAASIAAEPDPALKEVKTRLAGMLGALFAETQEARIAAIEALSGDLSVDVRAVLNTILATSPGVAVSVPEGANIAQVLVVGTDLSATDAYTRLVAAELAPALIPNNAIRDALVANIDGGMVGGLPVASLDTDAARATAYDTLAAAGTVAPRVTAEQQAEAVAAHTFYLQ